MTAPVKLTPDEAKRKILHILEQGYIELSLHCKRDSMPKRGVDFEDILQVLEYGQIIREPELDAVRQQWIYRVEGVDMENDELTAVTFIFDEQMTLFIITVF